MLALSVPLWLWLSAPATAQTSPSPASEALREAVLDPDRDFTLRHESCLELIALDPEEAFEAALTWEGRGGGHRATHCGAMALWALDQPAEAANRLDGLVADLPQGAGSVADTLRLNYGTEAAQSWLDAGDYDRAWKSADTALAQDPAHTEARVVRARAYFALDRLADAETDLSSVLAFDPGHASALRYRADVRLRLAEQGEGDLDAALADAEAALSLEPSVEAALVRGRVRQALWERDGERDAVPDGE